jgi:hypothetical protein
MKQNLQPEPVISRNDRPFEDASSSYGAELRGMRNRAFLQGERYRAQQARAIRAGCHPGIIEFERKLVQRLARLGVPMFCHTAMRGQQDQNELYVKGFSKAKGGESPHQYGLAVDIVHGTKAWDLNRKQWEIVGHVGKEVAAALGIKVEWGGDWRSFYDPAHWQLSDWRDLGANWKDKL